MIFIFSYDREQMLSDLLDEMPEKVTVLDDGSDYDPTPYLEKCDYYRSQHLGKEGFYIQWKQAFSLAKYRQDDLNIFLPDDVTNVDFDRISKIASELSKELYVCNILNLGHRTGWNAGHLPTERNVAGEDLVNCGFVDCGYFTNLKTLKAIRFHQPWINPKWFDRPNKSSGVGHSQTKQYRGHEIPMYLPVKSLAYHGVHESKMHPEERKRNPLISK